MVVGPVAVRFDRPMLPGVFDPTNWFVRIGGQGFNITAVAGATPNPEDVELVRQLPPFPDPGRDEVRYNATPADVKSLEGVPAQPFVNDVFIP